MDAYSATEKRERNLVKSSGSYPKIVAVTCTIPIYGALVMVQMCENKRSSAVEEYGSCFHIFRISQAVADARVQWCTAMLAEPSPKLDASFSSLEELGLCLSPITAYTIPSAGPKSVIINATFPVQLRSIKGTDMCLNWPFVRRNSELLKDFERRIAGMSIIVPIPTSKLCEEKSDIPELVMLSAIDDHEVAAALDVHRVFDSNCQEDCTNSDAPFPSSTASACSKTIKNRKNALSTSPTRLDGGENTGNKDSGVKVDVSSLKRTIHEILMGDDSDIEGGGDGDVESELEDMLQGDADDFNVCDLDLFGDHSDVVSQQNCPDRFVTDEPSSSSTKPTCTSSYQRCVFADVEGNYKAVNPSKEARVGIARQIYFTEWEADNYLSKLINGPPLRFRIANNYGMFLKDFQ